MHNEANDSFVVCMHGLLYEIVYTELHGNIAQYTYVCIYTEFYKCTFRLLEPSSFVPAPSCSLAPVRRESPLTRDRSDASVNTFVPPVTRPGCLATHGPMLASCVAAVG